VHARPVHAAALSGENAEGAETSREAPRLGVRLKPGVGFLVEPRAQKRRLGAWATSEEEPKPMRGSWGLLKCFPGVWRVNTLKPSL
jgi:hypothetical protein